MSSGQIYRISLYICVTLVCILFLFICIQRQQDEKLFQCVFPLEIICNIEEKVTHQPTLLLFQFSSSGIDFQKKKKCLHCTKLEYKIKAFFFAYV